jgi:GNAT superfamily N-acetyltransferase
MNITIQAIEATDETSADFGEFVRSRLMMFNEANARPYDFAPLQLSALDEQGATVGGLVAVTGWDWLMVDRLVVDEKARGKNIGKQLMYAALAEAKSRRCVGAMLDTFSFQARGFYEKLGFEVFGTLKDMPIGCERYWMQRSL